MKMGLGGHGIADIAKCLVALLSEFKPCLEEKDYLPKKIIQVYRAMCDKIQNKKNLLRDTSRPDTIKIKLKYHVCSYECHCHGPR